MLVPNCSTRTTPRKKRFFRSDSYKTEVLITSLIEMRYQWVTNLWAHDYIHNIIWVMWPNFVGDVIDRIYDVINFISKCLYFKKTGVAIFADFIKTLTIFFITIFKDSRKVKMNRNYVSKCNLYLYFLI